MNQDSPPKRKRGRPKGSGKKQKEAAAAAAGVGGFGPGATYLTQPIQHTSMSQRPILASPSKTNHSRALSPSRTISFPLRRSPRLNPHLTPSDSAIPFNFTMRTPTFSGWNPSGSGTTNSSVGALNGIERNSLHLENGFLPRSVDLTPSISSTFLSPIPMPRSGGLGIPGFPMIPPSLTPDMSPSLLASSLGGNNSTLKFQPLRRSPRFTPNARAMSSSFSPTVFWRSPAAGAKAHSGPTLDDAPLVMPPAYSSGAFLEPDQADIGFAPASRQQKSDRSPKSTILKTSNGSDHFAKSKKRSLALSDNLFSHRRSFTFEREFDEDDSKASSHHGSNNEEETSSRSLKRGFSPPQLTFPPPSILPIPDDEKYSHEETESPFGIRRHGSHGDLESSGGVGSSCHQCKSRRTKLQLAYCNAGFISEGGKKTKTRRPCRKKYCGSCLQKFYQERMPTPKTSWSCPACRLLCTCAACRKGKIKTSKYHQDRSTMSPATSIAVGLVYYGEYMDGNKKFKLDDIPEDIRAEARRAAELIVAQNQANIAFQRNLDSSNAELPPIDSSFSHYIPPPPSLTFAPHPALQSMQRGFDAHFSSRGGYHSNSQHFDFDEEDDGDHSRDSDASDSEIPIKKRSQKLDTTSLNILQRNR